MPYRFDPRELVIHLTIHAIHRGILRHISEAEINDLVHSGARRMEPGTGDRGGEIWIFIKNIKGRRLAAVAEILHPHCYVITVKNV